jgi:hypothetical protein
MDRQRIRDEQIVERYFQGKLTPDEEQAFEEAYLADRELLEELEVAERLRQGLRDHADLGQAEQAPRRAGWLGARPPYALAASVVAAFALASSGVLYVENRELRNTVDAPSGARVLALVSVRGAGNPNTIEAPRAGEPTVLLIDTGFSDYDRYRAVLARRNESAGETELFRSTELEPADDGTVALVLPARALTAGDYEVRLEGGRRDWPAERPLDELSRTPLTVVSRP